MQLRPEDISKIIKEQIKNYDNKIEQSETGTVIQVGDGIAKAYGLENCMANELLEFDDGSFGMAQNLEEDTVSIVLLSLRSAWRDFRWNKVLISVIVWGFLLSLYVTFYMVWHIHMWKLYLLGIPAEVIIIIWSRLNK